MRKFHWFELLLITLVMGVHIYAAFSAAHNFPSRWFTRDDAYYYFKVAQNISEGHGSTFDGINLTNGYHPLWMLVCTPIFALARFDIILPLRVLLVVMAALSAATSVILFRLLKKETSLPVAILASSFWALSLQVHSIVTQQGMETGIVAFSIVIFLYFLQKSESKAHLVTRDYISLSVAALFVLFSRLDGIYLILIAGVWLVFRKHPMRYMLPIDLMLAFSVMISAFIMRASLKVYLLAFDNSALLMAIITFLIQTVIFYFSGLYSRPASLQPVRIIIMSLVGVSLTTGIAAIIMFMIAANSNYDLPRAVPAIYFGFMLPLTLLTRLGLRSISPWPVTLSRDWKPSEGFLAGKSHIKTALEPIANWFHKGLVYFGIIGVGLGGYMLMNKLVFETFMPVSGQIKRWWGSLPNDVYGGGAQTFLDVFGIDPKYSQAWSLFSNPVFTWAQKLSSKSGTTSGWYWFFTVILILALAIIIFLNRKKSLPRIFRLGFIPLLISAELHAFIYGAMAYASTHEWYWVMEMLALVFLGAIGFQALLDVLPRTKIITISASLLVGAVSLSLSYAFSAELITRMPIQDDYASQPYMDTLPILEGFTEPGALIGMTGGGNSGYFIKDRTVINMDGLINSYAYFQALKSNQGGKFLAKIGMGYIFANRYIITSSMPYRYQFSDNELIGVTGAPQYGQKELMRYVPLQ